MLLNKHFKVYYFFIATCVILFSPIFRVNVYSQNSNEDIFTPKNRLAFGDNLFCEQDYLRAISEYRLFLREENNDTVRFKIAYALNEMGKLDEAIDNYKGLFYNTSLTEESRLEFFKANFKKNNYSGFRGLVDQNVYRGDNYSTVLNKLYQISYFLEGGLPDSSKLFSAFAEDDRDMMKMFYLKKKYPGYVSPEKAGILSAIIPGLGKIYSDETGDGITAFLYTSVLGFLAYNNFINDHPIRAWIFTGLAGYFYAANIYGSIAAAQNYNTAINFRFDTELKLYLNNKKYYFPDYEFLCR
ncbi:MAG: hypothetical protein CVV23_09260 [Ignavibacteriae bacterium HGW-Ignavibacteriae-2]|nr:MAG: hypothetical protein CVV23_09260 [Ignavibacteriae bacterium HGW-Ignavibacteriae-2]